MNSGSIDKEEEEEEDDKKSKNKTVKYGKIIKAIEGLRDNGISISPPYINKAEFSFSPNVDTNEVIYSLKAVSGVSEDSTDRIIRIRKEEGDYTSFQDFITRVPKLTHKEIVSLIKCGCFDEFNNDRIKLMSQYIKSVIVDKTSLNGQNLAYLIKYNLIPQEYEFQIALYNYKKEIYSRQFFHCIDEETSRNKNPHKWYKLNRVNTDFFNEHLLGRCEEGVHYTYTDNGEIIVRNEKLNKVIEKVMLPLTSWLGTQEAVDIFNQCRFNEEWKKQCEGSVSKWEMDTLSYYYHNHELANIDTDMYMFDDFFKISEEPIKVGEYMYKGVLRDQYAVHRICGTVISKNNTKHILTILTTSGVVDVKFYGGAYSHYNKQVSKLNQDGTSQVVEKSWFNRGQLLSIVGFRNGDMFIPRVYKDTIFNHTVQKIVSISEDGKNLVFQSERKTS